jgi:hypothetical protein
MSKVKIEGNASGTGTLTIAAPNTNTDRTLTLPDGAGEILTDASSLPAANLTGTLPAIDGSNLTNLPGGGKLLQVVYANDLDNDGLTSSSTSYADIPDMTVTITPSSTSSKILIISSVVVLVSGTDNGAYCNIVRNSTQVWESWMQYEGNNGAGGVYAYSGFSYVDSPSTTSATTYKIQGKCYDPGHGSVYFNVHGDGGLIAMEIGA